MTETNNSTNSKDLIPIILIGGLGVGGYFLYKYLKEEPEKEGFIWLRSVGLSPEAVVGSIINATVVGKNNTKESHLCFIKLVDQETGELLAPIQSAQVGAGLSQQFTFEFMMPNKPILRLDMKTGRIINSEEIVDDRRPYTITSKEDYPIEICRDPYCFIVNNQAEEIRMKEFLGIDPLGMDLDSYLNGSTPEQLDFWRNYWVNIWTTIHRQDMVDFVISKYNQYAGVVSAEINSFTITAT